MGKANACSRVIPFDSYITNPFDCDKFELKPQEKDELNQLGKSLQTNTQAFVALQGYTCRATLTTGARRNTI